jgi:transcriptional antiterminator RfaH
MSAWYTVFCKPRGETIAERNLCNQGYGVYLPRLSVRRRNAGIWVDRVEPLFPRYLFIQPRDAKQSLAPIRSTLGVSDLVRVGGQPALLPQSAIAQLRACENFETGARSGHTQFKTGERVRFVDGPFTGLEAVFEMDLGRHRALVLLDILGKSNQLRVERDWIAVFN